MLFSTILKTKRYGVNIMKDVLKNFRLETTSVWSFPDRGSWATHYGDYPGNWSPYVPRNLILKYTDENEWILDQFMGSGTTLIEAKLLNRNIIGTDINPKAYNITKERLSFDCKSRSHIHIRINDAQDLSFIKDNSIALICTHPPYADIIRYSENIKNDLSLLPHDLYLKAMAKVAREAYRVLKNNRICAIMVADIRKNWVFTPLGHQVADVFLNTGFTLKDIIIKEQHNCKSLVEWAKREHECYLIKHEYIFIFQKRKKMI